MLVIAYSAILSVTRSEVQLSVVKFVALSLLEENPVTYRASPIVIRLAHL
jgi:hypothetical protein